MNFKKISMYLASITVVSFLIGGIILFSTGGVSLDGAINIKDTQNFKIDEEKVSTLENIDEIAIEGVKSDIKLIPEERNDIKAHFYGNENSNKKPKLTMTTNGSKLLIKIERPKNNVNLSFGDISEELNLDINIPKTYEGKLNIGTVSGDVGLPNELKLSELTIQGVSNDTNLEKINVNKFAYGNVSGDLKANTLNTKDASFESVSGEIEVNNFTGNIKGNSVSGNTEILYVTFDNNINLESVSGDVEIVLPQDAQFYLDSDSVSGDIESDFPITVQGKSRDGLKGVVGSDKNKIEIETTSGDINIERK